MWWQLEVAKLAVKGHVPFADTLRRAKRQLWGYEPDPSNIRDTIGDLAEMQRALLGLSRSFTGARVLEIGTGWFPSVPIALALRGAREVIMVDRERHQDPVTFKSTVRHLRQGFPEFAALSADARFEHFPFRYLAPFDANELADASVDVVVSRAVLEHIPEAVIEQLMRQLSGKLSRQGVMVHCVDHSDHLSHKDKRLSMVNFLTWPDWQHSLVNKLTREGENRLCHSDYIRLFERAGFDLLFEERTIHQPTAAVVPELKLQPRFRDRSLQDLATMRSLFVIAPKAC